MKLTMEKGPREGETLKFSSNSLIKIGRVVKDNTISIKDAGISSKHICIQFNNHLTKWTISDLDSSNGTFVNGQILKPYVPSVIEDGDCIKIGELTSIIVEIGVESPIRLRRNPPRNKTVTRKPEDLDLEDVVVVVPIDGKKRTRVVRKGLRLESARSGVLDENLNNDKFSEKSLDYLDTNDETESVVEHVLEENLNNASGCLQVGKENEVMFDKVSEEVAEDVKDNLLGDTLETKVGSAEEHVVERLVSTQKDGEGKKDGCEGIVNETGFDDGRWQDLEKMTLLDFFSYMEVQLPKEVYDKSEKIISGLKEKACKCHEYRLLTNGG